MFASVFCSYFMLEPRKIIQTITKHDFTKFQVSQNA